MLHRINTVAGAALDVVRLVVSGAIGLALAETTGGAVRQLRLAIARVLKVRVLVCSSDLASNDFWQGQGT